MRRLIKYNLIFAAVAIMISSCHKKGVNFRIEGKLKIPAKSDVYLGNLGVDNVDMVDSTTIGQDGTFQLKGYCSEPSLYVLKLLNESIYLVIKPDDKLKIDVDNSLDKLSYYVNGSSDSRLVRELVFEQQKVLDEITRISIAYEKSKENPDDFMEMKQHFDSLYDNLLEKHKKYTVQVIKDNPGSLANIFALYQNFGKRNQPLFDKFNDFEIFNFVDSNLTVLYPNTPAVQSLNKDVTEIKEQLDYKKYSESLVQPGRKIPDFELVTIENEKINLSGNFENKPVIIFFFAVWNKSSIQQALELSAIAKKYHYRGLRVIGISFDKSSDKLKSFLKANEIYYPVVCDYKYWDSKYVKQFGVRSIPDIIVLNKNHIVENRGIEISELKLILEEWRKNNLF